MSLYRHLPGARLSEAVVANGLIFLAGQVPVDSTADARAQTADVLAQIDATLAELGSDKTRIVDATIFLADLADYAAMNAAWDAWVVPGQTPARATVEARLADPAWKVEIKIVAAR
jgi:enamine deaminase RidA (YjgF/YER057c/UK114 family)